MVGQLFGKKIQQSQAFTQDGKRVPLTTIVAEDAYVVQVKTFDKDKYSALQLGFGQEQKPTKPKLGHAKKLSEILGGNTCPKFTKEVSITKEEENVFKVGDKIKVSDIVKAGDKINISGTSKGKGFAGGVKRHHFRGGPKTHGQSNRHRAPGSIGQTTTPGRVYKGKHMAGHMGDNAVTVKNLVVLKIDEEKNTIYVKGLVPGGVNGILEIKKVGVIKNFSPIK